MFPIVDNDLSANYDVADALWVLLRFFECGIRFHCVWIEYDDVGLHTVPQDPSILESKPLRW